MLNFLAVLVFVISQKNFINCLPDLTPEAITVYRNPEFFKKLNPATNVNYNEESTEPPQEEEEYKYPGEPTKSNPPAPSPDFEVNYDNSPEFHHEPRDIFVDPTYKPSRRKGPYGPKYTSENNLEESSLADSQQPSSEENEEDENKNESKSYTEIEGSNESEEPQEYSSVLSSTPDEEYKSYHEPILLARTDFNSDSSSEFTSSTYNQPYAYNRSSPILYEDWKFYAYPKIHTNEFAKSDSSPIYSEEPASNAFEADRYTSYYRYDDDPEEAMDLFQNNEYKNLGSDTKHIYKKLLKPKFKPSILFKLHSKPKLKKLKLKVKKGHIHHANWFDEYPFNF